MQRRFPSWIAAALLVSFQAQATTYSITTLADGVATDGECTLREALIAAETDLAVDSCPAGESSDEIVLALTGTYAFAQGHAEVTVEGSHVLIRGADPAQWESYVVDLGGANRFLLVDSGAHLGLRHLVVRNGEVRGQPNAEGGALYIGDASATIERVRIADSRADLGGGVAFHGNFLGSLSLRHVDFVANEATSAAAFAAAMGGGLSVIRFDAESTVVLRDVSFESNIARAEVDSSNAFGAGLSLWLRNAGTGDLQRLHFLDNKLLGGGGGGLAGAAISIWLDDYESNPVYPDLLLHDAYIESSALVGASETNWGLAIDLQLISGVSAALDRIELRGNGVASSAPGIRAFSQSAHVSLTNVLAVDGSSRGVEVVHEGAGSVLIGHLTATGHAIDEVALSSIGAGGVRLENSIVWGNGVGDLLVEGTVDVAAENLIGIDPQFLDPGAGNFELATGSPAIDTGDSALASFRSFDALHRTRIAGLGTDLGALERDALFADGFESGDAGGWSTTEP